MPRPPVTYAQQLAAAKAEAAPWWEMLTRMNALVDQFLEEGAAESEIPPEVDMAEKIAHDRIARIYVRYGI